MTSPERTIYIRALVGRSLSRTESIQKTIRNETIAAWMQNRVPLMSGVSKCEIALTIPPRSKRPKNRDVFLYVRMILMNVPIYVSLDVLCVAAPGSGGLGAEETMSL